jgi:hypothetical protein
VFCVCFLSLGLPPLGRGAPPPPPPPPHHSHACIWNLNTTHMLACACVAHTGSRQHLLRCVHGAARARQGLSDAKHVVDSWHAVQLSCTTDPCQSSVCCVYSVPWPHQHSHHTCWQPTSCSTRQRRQTVYAVRTVATLCLPPRCGAAASLRACAQPVKMQAKQNSSTTHLSLTTTAGMRARIARQPASNAATMCAHTQEPLPQPLTCCHTDA